MNYDLGRFGVVLSVMLVGGVAGIGTGLLAVENVFQNETRQIGPWNSLPEGEAVSEHRWLRTAAALSGSYMPSAGGIQEYNAFRDSQGGRLDGGCTYYLSATNLPARSWTMSLYANDHFLPSNTGAPTVVISEDVDSDGRGRVQVQASGQNQGGAWLPSEPGGFSLTLRLYDSAIDPAARMAADSLFIIDRGECK